MSSGDFGAGEKNTQTMISKWNSDAYGSKNANYGYTDMWGLSEVQSGIWNGSSGWYVPSREEWAAFGAALTGSNYTNYGLSKSYWASSQYDTGDAWAAGFNSGYMYFISVVNRRSVRLGTTF